jgi:hypothetical protein
MDKVLKNVYVFKKKRKKEKRDQMTKQYKKGPYMDLNMLRFNKRDKQSNIGPLRTNPLYLYLTGVQYFHRNDAELII